MPVIATVPFVLVDAVMTVGTDDYQSAVSAVQFTPSVEIITWQGITPTAAFSAPGTPTWECKLSYAQDWKTTNSLAQYLLSNSGQSKVCVFKPQGATTGAPVFTATLIIVPGPIGGEVNTVQVGEVTLGVVGVPVKTTAP